MEPQPHTHPTPTQPSRPTIPYAARDESPHHRTPDNPIPRRPHPSILLYTMAQGDSERVREAQKLAKSDPRKAEGIYKEIISKPPSVTSDAAVKEYEAALINLGELYRDQK